jgi:hypothetical protein
LEEAALVVQLVAPEGILLLVRILQLMGVVEEALMQALGLVREVWYYPVSELLVV